MKKVTKKPESIRDLLVEYFKAHPKKDTAHGPVVDWVEAKYKKLYNKKPRDTWRSIRNLHEKGFLIKVSKGIYRYDPDMVTQRELEDFAPEQKKQIFEKDNYCCVQCGRRQDEGYELHADHRVPKNKGGKAIIDNGQTLCSVCNFRKKNYGQTESGKKMFIRLLETATVIGDEKNKKFYEELLSVYEKFNVNGHIVWRK